MSEFMVVGFRLKRKTNKRLMECLKVKGTTKNAFFCKLSKLIVDRPSALDQIYRDYFQNKKR